MSKALLLVVAYIRVSTDGQSDKEGPEVQRAAIIAWAKAVGARIVAWYEDMGESGSNGLESRVGLADAMAAVKAGDGQGIVVKMLDRFSRDVVLQEFLIREIARDGGQVFSTLPTEQILLNSDDKLDPSRKLMRVVLGAVAEYERDLIRMRLQGARASKAARGGYAGGPPPFGYRGEGERGKRVLVPDEAEQAILRRMVQLAEAGQSDRSVARLLNGEGLTTRRGGLWHGVTVRDALNRE